jgi:hypothetical protein
VATFCSSATGTTCWSSTISRRQIAYASVYVVKPTTSTTRPSRTQHHGRAV